MAEERVRICRRVVRHVNAAKNKTTQDPNQTGIDLHRGPAVLFLPAFVVLHDPPTNGHAASVDLITCMFGNGYQHGAHHDGSTLLNRCVRSCRQRPRACCEGQVCAYGRLNFLTLRCAAAIR